MWEPVDTQQIVNRIEKFLKNQIFSGQIWQLIFSASINLLHQTELSVSLMLPREKCCTVAHVHTKGPYLY